MSGLVAMALRVATRKILMGNTFAQNGVFDSPLDPISQLLDTAAGSSDRPIICLYTQETSNSPKGKDLGGESLSVDLVLLCYLTPAKTEVQDGILLETRESGAAMALDILASQINRALRFGPQKWRYVFDRMVLQIEKAMSRNVLVEVEQNVKIPTLEIILSLKTIPEPTYGNPLYGAWLEMDAAMRTDTELAGLADFIKALITEPTPVTDWRYVQAQGAYSLADVRAMGVAPVDATVTEAEEAAELEQLSTSGATIIGTPSGP